jgi:transcriptional regulator with XRE-family HTH domain
MLMPDAPILVPVPQTLDQQARERIRSWIQTTGVTQAQLGERIGRTQAWMSRYLKGEFDADLTTLDRMAQMFGFTLVGLLNLPSDPFEARLIEEVRALPPKTRQTLLEMLTSLRQTHQRKRRPPRP